MADAPKPKKGGKSKMMIVVGALVLAAAGAGGGFYFASTATAGTKGDAGAEGEEAVKPGAETLYLPLDNGFTSNLREPDRYIEMTVGVATQQDQAVLDAVKKHEIALRSAVLTILADQSVETVSTPTGKAKLRLQLRDTMNQTLKEKEGKGGVSDVYFTTFVLQ